MRLFQLVKFLEALCLSSLCPSVRHELNDSENQWFEQLDRGCLPWDIFCILYCTVLCRATLFLRTPWLSFVLSSMFFVSLHKTLKQVLQTLAPGSALPCDTTVWQMTPATQRLSLSGFPSHFCYQDLPRASITAPISPFPLFSCFSCGWTCDSVHDHDIGEEDIASSSTTCGLGKGYACVQQEPCFWPTTIFAD